MSLLSGHFHLLEGVPVFIEVHVIGCCFFNYYYYAIISILHTIKHYCRYLFLHQTQMKVHLHCQDGYLEVNFLVLPDLLLDHHHLDQLLDHHHLDLLLDPLLVNRMALPLAIKIQTRFCLLKQQSVDISLTCWQCSHELHSPCFLHHSQFTSYLSPFMLSDKVYTNPVLFVGMLKQG